MSHDETDRIRHLRADPFGKRGSRRGSLRRRKDPDGGKTLPSRPASPAPLLIPWGMLYETNAPAISGNCFEAAVAYAKLAARKLGFCRRRTSSGSYVHGFDESIQSAPRTQ